MKRVDCLVLTDNRSVANVVNMNRPTLFTKISGLSNSIGKTHLGSCVKTLVGSSTTTNHCIFAIEKLGDFLKRSVTGLNVEELGLVSM